MRNIPLIISDYKKAEKLLEKKYKSLLIKSNKDIINYITYKYTTEKIKIDLSWLIIPLLIMVILLIIYICILHYIIFSNNCLLETVLTNITLNDNNNTFNLWSNRLTSNYYPNCFVPNNFCITNNTIIIDKQSLVLEGIISKQYETILYITNITKEHAEQLIAIKNGIRALI